MTRNQLEQLVKLLNLKTASPVEYSDNGQKPFKANVKNFHICHENDQFSLQRVLSEAGATQVFVAGSKQVVANYIWTFMKGFEEGREYEKAGNK